MRFIETMQLLVFLLVSEYLLRLLQISVYLTDTTRTGGK